MKNSISSIQTFPVASKEASSWLADLRRRRVESFNDARATADAIVTDVRQRGDAAIADLVRRFDGVDLRCDELLIAPAAAAIDRDLRDALELAIARVEAFHRRQRRSDDADRDGELRERVRPLRRVGLYVPGGNAVYLSTLIMSAVPARIAGVRELIVLTTSSAASNPSLQWLCLRLGVAAIYRGGGASVAAAAIGTASLSRVDKITGPGNRYVAALKQVLNGIVGIDMTAGPSEVAVVADDTADPAFVISDLLAQSEHGEDSSAVCIALNGFDRQLLPQLEQALSRTNDVARASFASNGAVLVAESSSQAIAFVNDLAPEHVSLQTRDALALAEQIENSGAIYAGPWSAVAIGDYVAGPNHILPTAGGARFSSPLGVDDFMKRSHVVALRRETFESIAPAARLLAATEGLPLHAESIEVREAKS